MSFIINPYRYGNVTDYDLSNLTEVAEFYIGDESLIATGVTFDVNGDYFYMSEYLTANIYQYSMSTAWDITTASLLNTFASSVSNNQDLEFKPDGTKLYVLRHQARIYEYNLSTAWDVSTASYSQYKTLANNPSGLKFKPDGTKMFYINTTTDLIYEYSLSTAWDISTLSFTTSYDFSSVGVDAQSMEISPEGNVLIFYTYSNSEVHKIELSTSWDLSTASSVLQSANKAAMHGMYLKDKNTLFSVNSFGVEKVYKNTM